MAAAKMRVFVTGATGALGAAATAALVRAGHEVHGVARSEEGRALIRALGATPVAVDLLDAPAVAAATRGCDALVHLATKIPEGAAMARMSAWRENDRLRLDGTRHLIAAAEAHGVARVVFESLALAYPDRGDAWIDEDEPLAPVVPVMRSAVEAEAMLQDFGRRGGAPVCLRLPRIYGPGRASRSFLDAVAARRMPVVGGGENLVSSVHVDDVASAVVSALTLPPGAYNVADDEPLTQRVYVEAAARALRAASPRRLPYWTARLLLGRFAPAAVLSQRVSNRRLREAGWRPGYRSALDGWPAVVAATAAARPSAAGPR